MSIEQFGGRSRIPATMAVLVAAIAAAPTARADGAFVDCGAALRETIATGRPTVVVVTSRAVPASIALRDAIVRDLLGSAIGDAARFAELPVELYPDRVAQLGIERFPTLIAYGREGGTLARLGRLDGPADAVSVAAWLGSLGLSGGTGARAPADPAVARTAMVGGDRGQLVAVPAAGTPTPTPQGPPPSPPAPGMAVVPVTPPPSMSTVVTQPGPPAVVVQPQSPQIYVQPMAPRIILGQMPAPEITVLQQPQAPPTVNLGVVNAPQAAYVPYASTPMPSPQSPAAAFPTTPTVQAPAYTAAYAPAPPVPQDSIVGATAIALLLENPDLINTLIGYIGRGFCLIGEALERRGHPHVRIDQPATPKAVQAIALSPSTAVPAHAVVPLLQPGQPSMAIVPQSGALLPPGPPARGVTPSPQGPPPTPTKHGLIGHLLGHR